MGLTVPEVASISWHRTWPAAFFIGGDDEVKQLELSQLKGKVEAVQTAMIRKKCGI
jgi:hypothetical protein